MIIIRYVHKDLEEIKNLIALHYGQWKSETQNLTFILNWMKY